MKTNMLFVCQYCDKKLGSRRTVKMHISNLHKQDPENPLMYHSILVSPKEVNNLLERFSQAQTKTETPKVMNLDINSGNLMRDSLEKVTSVDPENESSNVNPEKGIRVDENVLSVDPANVSSTHSVEVISSSGPLEKVVGVDPPPKNKPIKTKKVKVKKEPIPCYDYRRLANYFNKPELVEKTKSKESTKISSSDSVGNSAEDIIHPVTSEQPDNLNLSYQEQVSPSVKRPRSCVNSQQDLLNSLNQNLDGTDDTSSSPEPSSSHLSTSPSTEQDEYRDTSGPGRIKFKVPYNKRPRGKCADWESCLNCSLESDCGYCRNCLDKSLHQKCVLRQCGFANKKLKLKLHGGSGIGSTQLVASEEYPPWGYPDEQYPSYELYQPEQYPPEHQAEQYPPEQYPLEDSLTPQNKEANSEVEPTIQSIEVLDPVLERVVEGSDTKFSLEENVNDEYPPGEEPQEFIEKLKNNSSASTNEEGTSTESKETREETENENETNKLPRTYECKNCLKLLSRHRYAINHCKSKPWKCDKCDKEIKQTNNINRHRVRCQKRAKIEAQKNSKATEAGKSTETSHEVNSCTFCEKVFKNSASLKTHMNFKHKENKEGNLVCEHCEFRTMEESQLSKHHTLKHKAKAKVHCEKCAFYCHSKSGLRKHSVNVHVALIGRASESDVETEDNIVESEVNGESVVEIKNNNGTSVIDSTGDGLIVDETSPEEMGDARSAFHPHETYELIVILQEDNLPEPNIVIVGSTERTLTYAEL